jgi:hypothetical protein
MMTPSGLVDIARQQNVFADRLCRQARQGDRLRQRSNETRPVSSEAGRDEEHELVDEAGGEKRPGQRRASLEQERLNPVLPQPA